MKLPRDEWKKLDDLLTKVGFGGYYDLLECLRDVGRRFNRKLEASEDWSKEDDLHTMVKVLMKLRIDCPHPSFAIVNIPEEKSTTGEDFYQVFCWSCGEDVGFSFFSWEDWQTRKKEIAATAQPK